MNREETLKLIEKQKKKIDLLWNSGIPELNLSQIEINELKKSFYTWSINFQLDLLENGIEPIINQYEELINSIETATCKHGEKIYIGNDYNNCCGISYEYLNDISCRDAIEIIKNTVSRNNFIKYERHVELLDIRFKAVPKTNKWIVNSKLVEKYKESNYWWYFGLPLTVKE